MISHTIEKAGVSANNHEHHPGLTSDSTTTPEKSCSSVSINSTDYASFLDAKSFRPLRSGFECSDLNPSLKPFQDALVRKALSLGRYAFWWGCGLGKASHNLHGLSKL